MSSELHRPVMPAQAIAWLRPRPGGRYVDLTIGMGGHARAILEASAPDGILLGIDRDAQALHTAGEQLAAFSGRLHLVHASFGQLDEVLRQLGWREVDGTLADLGVSSLQLSCAERGFSFQTAGPLDMRMDPSAGEPLSVWLERLADAQLSEALERLGEVRHARSVARRIKRALREGRLNTTLDLAGVVGPGRGRERIHPATRVFMALRLLVNAELDELGKLLEQLPDPLAAGGRAVFIAFHSLEDRLVKQRLAALGGRCNCPPGLPVCRCGSRARMKVLTRGAERPEPAEVEANPRARSARLRAAERLGEGSVLHHG